MLAFSISLVFFMDIVHSAHFFFSQISDILLAFYRLGSIQAHAPFFFFFFLEVLYIVPQISIACKGTQKNLWLNLQKKIRRRMWALCIHFLTYRVACTSIFVSMSAKMLKTARLYSFSLQYISTKQKGQRVQHTTCVRLHITYTIWLWAAVDYLLDLLDR